MKFGSMMNNRENMEKVEKQALGNAKLGNMLKLRFSQMEWPWKNVKTDSSSHETWHT